MIGKQWNSPPPLQIDARRSYRARIETEHGAIVIDLYAQHARPDGQ